MAEGEIRDIGPITNWAQLERACNILGITVEECIQATMDSHSGELDTSEVDEVEEDLDVVYKLLDTARTELLDEAMGANISRRHHLESAVACFESIGTLFKAEEIIKEVLDLREGSEDPPEA